MTDLNRKSIQHIEAVKFKNSTKWKVRKLEIRLVQAVVN